MADGGDQNRSEAATPFKLRRARERGMVARGLDLAFVAVLLGTMAYAAVAGPVLVATLRLTMAHMLRDGIATARDPHAAALLSGQAMRPLFQPLALLGGTLVGLVLLVEIVQLRGLLFSAAPMKPDFTRLNPAAGAKKLLSLRMLKEAVKSVLKMGAYTATAVFAIRGSLAGASGRIIDASTLSGALWAGLVHLLLLFTAIAAGAAMFDQLLARGAFAKQMMMSRREVTRETKDREGDPRIRSKRRQLHTSFVRQAKGMAQLPGSDMLLVNPLHVAVALAYRPGEHLAPVVTAKGAERQAAMLRRAAMLYGVPVIHVPQLARALFRECELNQSIGAEHYRPVADLYHKLSEANHA